MEQPTQGRQRATRHRSRRERGARKAALRLYPGVAAILASGVISVLLLRPDPRDEPVVTIFMPSGCRDCQRWFDYMEQHGFQSRAGRPEDLLQLRRQLRLPSGFDAPLLATVNGRFVSGFVPAREVHALARGQLGSKVIGVAVHRSSAVPWNRPSMSAQGVTVFAVLPGGMMRPVRTYH